MTSESATLERRLANFRTALARAERGPSDGAIEPARRRPAADHAERLAAALDGEVVRTTAGTYVRVEAASQPLPLDRDRLARLPGQPPPRVPLLCLDTETTGLGTAAGTYAFLIGLGWWQGDRFRTVQLLLPDQPDEAALLNEVAARIPADGWLVTYNGRGFDWPLLVTRFRMARHGPPVHAGHLDLLPLVRRVFRHRLADARLKTVEEDILGVRRHGDVEGWEIPGRYLDFLRGGGAGPLAEVARHNAEDVVSLARLLAHIESRYGDAERRRTAPPGDLAGFAAAFGRERRHDEALACLDAALEAPPIPALAPGRPLTWTVLLTTRADAGLGFTRSTDRDPEDGPPRRTPPMERQRLLSDRARLLKRLGQEEDALDAWRDLALGGGPLAAAAWVEVAKLLEHRRRDAAGALAATRSAQVLAERTRGLGRPLPRLERELAI
ncbi:MAG: ribonuclease H-like domain-containing protein, partial [Chloroflexota bacterium]|nr:ribonuclease H-like domain-containing protein [Chloroflexota bacterium]